MIFKAQMFDTRDLDAWNTAFECECVGGWVGREGGGVTDESIPGNWFYDVLKGAATLLGQGWGLWGGGGGASTPVAPVSKVHQATSV